MVKIVKLVTGEMYVGEWGNSTLKNPLYLVITEQGPKLIDMMNIFTEDKELYVDDAHLLHVLTPTRQIEEGYQRAQSPIVQPKKTLLV
jgi:hypothetical protein